ncbi:MAG TPA: hypothetical protein VLC71_13895 [Thermomonas sp.]|nr:hypothetical protein [Thermomonas sp.]
MSRIPAHARILDAHRRLRHWLLAAPIQVMEGPQRGGVAGMLTAEGRVEYVYPEITGYYLHWLARPDVHALPQARARAAAAVDWAERAYAVSEPMTRVHLQPHADDWRNRNRFVFDLGMLAGGLAAAWSRELVRPMPALAARVQELALGYVDGSGLLQAVAQPAELQRWSTSAGPFLAKPASRLLMLDRVHPGPASLRDACDRTLAAYPPTGLPGHVELHPALYHLEGAACRQPDHAGMAASLACMLAMEDGEGRLPETPQADLLRCDVTAQALRLSLWLQEAGVDPTDEARMTRMAGALADAVDGDGGVGFRLDRHAPERNIWCAMFAEQALAAWLRAQAHGRSGLVADDIV